MTLNLTEALAALTDLGIGDVESLQIAPAERLAAEYYPHFDPGQPMLVTGCADAAALARLAHALAQVYPPGHPLTCLAGGERQSVPLAELTGAPAPCHLFVPPLGGPVAYADLQDVAVHLRAPEGCPWDRALTWAKLRSSLLEETHELLAALDSADPAKVREELGDVLLQVALLTEIATEEGRFRFPDVIAGIVTKLIRRHPHVFGDAVVSGTDEVLANWEAIKRTEREQAGERRSPLAGVPVGLPALAQADAYLDRLSRLRADAPPAAPWAPLADLPDEAEVSPEVLGEALLGLVAWARARGVDAESALRAVNARLAARVELES